MAEGREIPPIHPGEILLEEYLKPMGLSQYRLAKDISVDSRRINEIVFGTSARFWINLQSHYDLEVQEMELGERLDKEVKVYA